MLVAGTPEVGAFAHGYTYSAHPIAAAAGMANLDIFEREDLVGKSAKTGAYFQKVMRDKIGSHPLVGEVRGVALMCGVEIVANKAKKEPLPMSLKVAPRLANMCLEEGLISRALMGANAMAFSPPLVITESECDEIVARFTRALNKMADTLTREGAWKGAA